MIEAGTKTGAIFATLTGAILVALLCCALVPAGAAAAEVVFGSPKHLAGPDAVEPEIAVGPQDTATIVWHEVSGGDTHLIKSIRATPGEPPEPVPTLAEWPELGAPHGCVCPRMAMDPSGRAAVTWMEFDGAHLLIRAIQLGPDGVPIGPAKTLSQVAEDSYTQNVAIDPQGRATVTWVVDGPLYRTEAARLLPDGSSEPAQTISEPGVSTYPDDIAAAPDGEVAVTLVTQPEALKLATIDPDGDPAGVQTLSPPGEDAGAGQLASDSQGAATVAWMRFGADWEAKAIRVAPDGTLGPVQTITEDGEEALEPKPAVGPDDHVSVVWSSFDQEIKLVRLGADAVPGPVHLVSDPARTSGAPQIVPFGDGTDLVVWAHTIVGSIFPPSGECLPGNPFEFDSDVVQAAVVDAEGKPGPIQLLSAKGQQSLEPMVAVDSQGRATIAWHSFDGTAQCEPILTRIQWSQGEWLDPPPPDDPPPPAGSTPPAGGTPPPPPAAGVLRLAGSAHLRRGRGARRPMTLARGGYALPANGRRLLGLSLSRHGRELLRGATRDSIKVKVEGRGVQGGTVTVFAGPRRKGAYR